MSELEAETKYGKMEEEELEMLPREELQTLSKVKYESGQRKGCATKVALKAQKILWQRAGGTAPKMRYTGNIVC